MRISVPAKTMAAGGLLSRASQSGVHVRSLACSLRSLAISPSPIRPPQTQARSISQSALSTSRQLQKTRTFLQTIPVTLGSLGAAHRQQTRGMKVHSSVKKRCEHCKVRSFAWVLGHVQPFDLPDSGPASRAVQNDEH